MGELQMENRAQIQNMPDQPSIRWGIRPQDCDWDYVRIRPLNCEQKVNKDDSHRLGWDIYGDKEKFELAINIFKIHDLKIDTTTLRVIEDIEERIQFLVYRYLNSINHADRILVTIIDEESIFLGNMRDLCRRECPAKRVCMPSTSDSS